MKIGERGQVTIPKKIRDAFGLYPEVEVEFEMEPDGVKIRKKISRQSPVKTVFGILKKKKNRTDAYIREVRGE